jgi:hypothetical protein
LELPRSLLEDMFGILIATVVFACALLDPAVGQWRVTAPSSWPISSPPKSPPTPKVPDAIGAWLSVNTGGHDYPLEMTPEIVSLLSEAMDAAVKQAVIGTWWQSGWGGGAHAAGVPHVFFPDYRGRSSLSPQTGSIQMHIDNGLFVPSDFSGHGSVRINKNQLTVRNVWFGTRQAKQKPDICALTFTRK